MTLAAPPPAPAAPPLNPLPACPFVGLVPFEEANEDYFFGRERERDVIVANMTASRLTLLYAPSGVGKSSVLRAAVLPHAWRLADEAFADLGTPGDLTVYVSEWGGDPAETVIRSLLLGLHRVAGARSVVSASSTSHFDDQFLSELVAASGVSAVHLVLDQFEEFFVYHGGTEKGTGFIDDLGTVLRSRTLPVNVLLSIREDALAELDRFKGRVPNLFGNYIRLSPLDRRAGRSAIVGPLRRYDEIAAPADRMTIDPMLIDELLDQVEVGRVAAIGAGTAPPEREARSVAAGSRRGDTAVEIETPYLQLVLTRLWDEERAAGSSELRPATLERLGGAETIVRSHLDDVIAELSPEQIETAAAVFHHLVTTSGSKIALTAEDLSEWSGRNVEDVRNLLDTLCAGRQRILRPVPPPIGTGGPPRYEIYHDVMGSAVLDWRQRYVAKAESERARRELLAAAHAESAAARRRLRRVSIAAVAMAAVLVVVAVLGVVAYRRSRTAQQQRLLAEAAAALGADPERSLRRAAEGFDIVADDDAREAILLAASAPRGVVIAGAGVPAAEAADGVQADAVDLDVAPDGSAIVVYEEDGSVRVLDGTGNADHAMHADLRGHVIDGVTDSTASTVAIASDAGEVVLLEAGSDQALVLTSTAGPFARLVMVESDEDDFVVVIRAEQPAEIYRASTGDLVATLGDVVTSAAVGATDGGSVVTTGQDGRLRRWDATSGALVAEAANAATSALYIAGISHDPGGGDLIVGVGLRWADRDLETGVVTWDGVDGSEATERPVSADYGELTNATVDAETGLVMLAVGKRGVFVDPHAAPDDPDAFISFSAPETADWVYDVATVKGPQDAYGARWLATAGGDGRVLVWSAYSTNRPTFELSGHEGAVLDLSAVRSGTALVSLGVDGTVRWWDLPVVTRYDRHLRSVWSLDSSAQSGRIVTASLDGTAAILGPDMVSLATIQVDGQVVVARFDPTDERRVFTLTKYGTAPAVWMVAADGTVTAAETLLSPISGSAVLTSMDVSRDGTSVAAADTEGRIHVWDVRTGEEEVGELTLEHGAVWDVAFDPRGDRIAATSFDATRVWSLTGDEEPLSLPTRNAEFVAFDPTGRLIAVTAQGGTIDLWSHDGEQHRTMEIHSDRITQPNFSADGRYLAVGTAEGLIEVIDVESGRSVLLSRVHGDSVNDVVFDRGDSSRLVSASDDTTVAVSKCATCSDQGADEVIDDALAWVRSVPDDNVAAGDE